MLRPWVCAEAGAEESDGAGGGVRATAGSLALPETMDPDQEEQLREQREMQRLEVTGLSTVLRWG